MLRELIITIYLFLIKVFFSLFKLFPLKEHVLFIVSFGDNSKYVLDEMKRQNIQHKVIVHCKKSSERYFLEYKDVSLVPLNSKNPYYFLVSIFHLATSKTIFVDNYFGFLSATNFKKDVDCIQLWHASGAIKKFGLMDESVKHRSKKALDRFQQVYSKFNKVVVGSDTMSEIFQMAFGLTSKNILKTGIPRTDYFYKNSAEKVEIQQLNNRQVILYAPTYRDKELDEFKLKLDLDLMYKELSKDYVVALRLHPAVKINSDITVEYPNFVYDYSGSKYDINELLLISDYLITDYSSILYEYSILNRPMIFFAYDLEEYINDRGLWEDYEKMVPGPVVRETSEIINFIREKSFNIETIKDFSLKWNRYSLGTSSENVVKAVFDTQSKKTKQYL
ncbi:CDP-glycerol glycerophosphotransferase family protein [Bacillus sp. 31A1R]|uniref:CDP-glycerol glycerophosphotransferase family protein n=1 Tax=Robertmurraya mangrovi TaxID=3098077 RepID=A0ABU5IXS1_9BACI|nr:CDP-glycerol glycerophosphotransferase family protein [Bacillus sp. 31A1R]MDZ5471927.1 CDP-glycerol glycerophosphotransferase family protein [Bacillus sp. 31A1R]